MNNIDYRNALIRLDLTQSGAADLLGSDPRTSRRWANGERDIPIAIQILIRLLLRKKITPADIEKAKI